MNDRNDALTRTGFVWDEWFMWHNVGIGGGLVPAGGWVEPYDMTDNPDCMPNGLNLSEATALSAPMVGIFNSIDHTVPKNAGSFRRIQIKLRDNSIVGRPSHPTSCSVATTNVADRVANPVQCAIAELADGLGQAETGALIPPSCGVVSGVHDGRPFVNEVYLGCTGGAGERHGPR